MTPSADQQEQMKMAQRSQRKLAQGFQMYTYFIATGSRIDEALEKMEAAMESWTDYEDRHTIDMPAAFDMNALMGTLGRMADTMQQRGAPQVDADLVTEMANALEESVCVLESEGKKSKANKMLLARICGLVERADAAAKTSDTTQADLVSEPSSDSTLQTLKGSK